MEIGHRFVQTNGIRMHLAEADLQRDVRTTIRMTLYGASGENPTVPDMIVGPERGFLGLGSAVPDTLPNCVTNADLDFYTQEFERTGFTGGLNWYRNIDRNWELTAPWSGAQVKPPALYVVGDRDVTYHFPGSGPGMVEGLRRSVPNLKQGVVLDGCGHWTQQERAEDVNRLLIDFLRSL